MDGVHEHSAREETKGTAASGRSGLSAGARSAVCTAQVAVDAPDAVHQLSARLDAQLNAQLAAQLTAQMTEHAGAQKAAPSGAKAATGMTLVCLFASPDADFAALTQAAATAFGTADVLACTTAGELGENGYETGQIVAVGFPCAYFEARTTAITDLDRIDAQALIDRLIHNRMDLNRCAPDMPFEFAFTMVDGLSLREEHLTSVLASGLGPMPLFGGSSGDGTAFTATWLSHKGVVMQNAALLAMVRSRCPVRVFSLDHLLPTDTRMVVTRATPDARIVHEINAEPAAQEYARLLGKDPLQLDPFTFAAHPVVVRLGDKHHVRAIQRVSENGDLHFFSAINEGMVLTLAAHQDIVEHLDDGLAGLARDGVPDMILGCDCILRRISAEQAQQTRAVSEILRRNNVVGFSTYGEQIGGLHVNQTLTGVAIYPPTKD